METPEMAAFRAELEAACQHMSEAEIARAVGEAAVQGKPRKHIEMAVQAALAVVARRSYGAGGFAAGLIRSPN